MMFIEDVKEYLPQRYPFLLVDRVTELEPDKYIKAYKNVSTNEEFFLGHFPNKPIMPGVLIIEAMAQASGVLGFKSQEKKPRDGYLYYFVGADAVRFKRPVVPGDQLLLKIQILKFRRNIVKASAKACVEDKVVAEAEIMATLG